MLDTHLRKRKKHFHARGVLLGNANHATAADDGDDNSDEDCSDGGGGVGRQRRQLAEKKLRHLSMV